MAYISMRRGNGASRSLELGLCRTADVDIGSVMPNLLFFTAANKAYEDFAPLYAFSILFHVADSAVEIAVEDVPSFHMRYGAALTLLANCFGSEKIVVRDACWTLPNGRRILPNTVRFITTPKTTSEYVYIGDIDVIILEPNLLAMHLRDMKLTGLPYSNSVRPGTTRMSGLHFTKATAYYPLPDVSDLEIDSMNDEMVLYEIIRRRGSAARDDIWYRPIHGIHISPNRPPERVLDETGKVVIPGWGINPYVQQWLRMAANTDFRRLRTLLSLRVRETLSTIDRVISTLGSEDPAAAVSAQNQSSFDAILPQQFTLKSTGNWSGQSFIITPLPTGSAIKFTIQPSSPCGTIELHIVIRNQAVPARYRWLLPFRGELTEPYSLEASVDHFSVVGGAALSECAELIIRIRAHSAIAAEVVVSEFQIIRHSDVRPTPQLGGGRAASLTHLANNAAHESASC